MKKFFLFGLVAIFPLFVSAQEHSESNENEAAENFESEEFERGSAFGVFIGGTSISEETAFTFGLDYQYRINKWLGVGALVDHAITPINSTLLGPSAFLHVRKLEFVIAPCVEFLNEEENIGVFRFGACYEFEFEKLIFKPSIDYDTERRGESAWVYGFTFAWDL